MVNPRYIAGIADDKEEENHYAHATTRKSSQNSKQCVCVEEHVLACKHALMKLMCVCACARMRMCVYICMCVCLYVGVGREGVQVC